MDNQSLARELVIMRNNVWADGFGVFHASIPLSGSRAKDAAKARELIGAALRERFGDDVVFSVTRERVTNHGTVVYVESRR